MCCRCVRGGHGRQQHREALRRFALGWRRDPGSERGESGLSQSGPSDPPADPERLSYGPGPPTPEDGSTVTTHLRFWSDQNFYNSTEDEPIQSLKETRDAHSVIMSYVQVDIYRFTVQLGRMRSGAVSSCSYTKEETCVSQIKAVGGCIAVEIRIFLASV